ncbi:uncharacterized protein LY79DRAFT_141148 [Colletotrichum navitas]|uniref:Uncharacterized protein n=1 Tax=Colletotrichum navitas TaxID=681940 RepID=A0AAD8QDR3_9PEZI|nr:uncharacterized protein LY79DRAFT_141148 [Colletotrichum navitas]KAK1599443.1 hypothetical protein LY79DRAFT_141148 [Colletotrichum navitas]
MRHQPVRTLATSTTPVFVLSASRTARGVNCQSGRPLPSVRGCQHSNPPLSPLFPAFPRLSQVYITPRTLLSSSIRFSTAKLIQLPTMHRLPLHIILRLGMGGTAQRNSANLVIERNQPDCGGAGTLRSLTGTQLPHLPLYSLPHGKYDGHRAVSPLCDHHGLKGLTTDTLAHRHCLWSNLGFIAPNKQVS